MRKIAKLVFLQSERDGIVRAANAEFLAELFLTCKVTMVPGTEHALSVEIPNLIDDAVARVCG
jgi:hypothetical protein